MSGKKFDNGKLKYSLLPAGTVEAVVEVLGYGAQKYGANNWQGLDNFEDRYYDALMRHLSAYRTGEQCDEESGLPHLAHALCNVAFLLWRQQQGKRTNSQTERTITPSYTIQLQNCNPLDNQILLGKRHDSTI